MGGGGKGGYTGAPVTFATQTQVMFTTQALRQSDWRNCGLCVGLYAEGGATLLGEFGDEKTRRIS